MAISCICHGCIRSLHAHERDAKGEYCATRCVWGRLRKEAPKPQKRSATGQGHRQGAAEGRVAGRASSTERGAAGQTRPRPTGAERSAAGREPSGRANRGEGGRGSVKGEVRGGPEPADGTASPELCAATSGGNPRCCFERLSPPSHRVSSQNTEVQKVLENNHNKYFGTIKPVPY